MCVCVCVCLCVCMCVWERERERENEVYMWYAKSFMEKNTKETIVLKNKKKKILETIIQKPFWNKLTNNLPILVGILDRWKKAKNNVICNNKIN